MNCPVCEEGVLTAGRYARAMGGARRAGIATCRSCRTIFDLTGPLWSDAPRTVADLARSRCRV
jgi:hypothetical protein